MVAYEREVDTFIAKSCLLLEAIPSARLTTKYRKLNDSRSFVTAKTYDAETGAIVKFKTDKTIDLGRLMVGTSKITSKFCGINIEEQKQAVEDVPMEGAEEQGASLTTTVKLGDGKDVAAEGVVAESKPGSSTNASKKKKKKGKK